VVLYTFIIEHAGGTFVRQLRAATVDEAASQMWRSADWISAPPPDDEKPIEVEGVKRTWCTSATINGKLALIHTVHTED
jgi:hypothetical protein